MFDFHLASEPLTFLRSSQTIWNANRMGCLLSKLTWWRWPDAKRYISYICILVGYIDFFRFPQVTDCPISRAHGKYWNLIFSFGPKIKPISAGNNTRSGFRLGFRFQNGNRCGNRNRWRCQANLTGTTEISPAATPANKPRSQKAK